MSLPLSLPLSLRSCLSRQRCLCCQSRQQWQPKRSTTPLTSTISFPSPPPYHPIPYSYSHFTL